MYDACILRVPRYDVDTAVLIIIDIINLVRRRCCWRRLEVFDDITEVRGT